MTLYSTDAYQIFIQPRLTCFLLYMCMNIVMAKGVFLVLFVPVYDYFSVPLENL